MKLLITGICGFVGSTLAKAFIDADSKYEITGTDNLSRPGSWLNREDLIKKGIKVVHGDIRLTSDLEVLPKVDWVIDAAANPSVLAGVDGKTSSLQLIQHNLSGTINLLEYCKRNGSGFILLSTNRVYSIPPLCNLKMVVENGSFRPDVNQAFPPGISTKGVNEEYSTNPPISLYGTTKLSSEQLALEYGITFNFPVWINRCGVMAGAGQFGHPGQGIFAYWIHSYKEKKQLKYIGFGGSGYQVRDCLHPKDLIGILMQQFKEPASSKKNRIVNLSGGVDSSMSLLQLTEWCDKRFGVMSVEKTKTERPFDIPWMVLDSSKASEIWNWKPQISVYNILDEISLFAESKTGWIELSSS